MNVVIPHLNLLTEESKRMFFCRFNPILPEFSRDTTVLCLNFETPKIINFPLGTNGKLIIPRCPNM